MPSIGIAPERKELSNGEVTARSICLDSRESRVVNDTVPNRRFDEPKSKAETLDM